MLDPSRSTVGSVRFFIYTTDSRSAVCDSSQSAVGFVRVFILTTGLRLVVIFVISKIGLRSVLSDFHFYNRFAIDSVNFSRYMKSVGCPLSCWC